MREVQPTNRVRRFLETEEPQEWLPASWNFEPAWLAPDGWALVGKGLVVYDVEEGRHVVVPAWTFHGAAKDARGA